ncbi:hypothetical protein [Dyadobacter bucti]|uniref:hypothetical protein n=1 Tax=Dyadobacter bucti TaxID=2572203 RepID=UPI00110984CA|nr:hypothetical protein [Dyadobacter bucti]
MKNLTFVSILAVLSSCADESSKTVEPAAKLKEPVVTASEKPNFLYVVDGERVSLQEARPAFQDQFSKTQIVTSNDTLRARYGNDWRYGIVMISTNKRKEIPGDL